MKNGLCLVDYYKLFIWELFKNKRLLINFNKDSRSVFSALRIVEWPDWPVQLNQSSWVPIHLQETTTNTSSFDPSTVYTDSILLVCCLFLFKNKGKKQQHLHSLLYFYSNYFLFGLLLKNHPLALAFSIFLFFLLVFFLLKKDPLTQAFSIIFSIVSTCFLFIYYIKNIVYCVHWNKMVHWIY